MNSSFDRWMQNPFLRTIASALRTQAEHRAETPMQFDEAIGAWCAETEVARASRPALLQGRSLVVEATDKGFLLMPLGRSGRYLFDIAPLGPRSGRVAIAPARFSWSGPWGQASAAVDPFLPMLHIEVESGAPLGLRWMPGRSEPKQAGIWFEAAAAPEILPEFAYNNSRVPDPLAPNQPSVGLLLAERLQAAWLAPAETGRSRNRGFELLGEYLLPAGVCETIELSTRPEQTRQHFALVLAQDADEAQRCLAEADGTKRTQDTISITTPDAAINRQLAFSVANTLQARSTGEGRDIFLHGRRDRGYADVSHLHQSYQMHLPALAAGAGASVRSELLAYLDLQDDAGGLIRCPRPGDGSHPYVGTYTNGHLPMALHRYISWTGDFSVLESRVRLGTVLEASRASCRWLWSRQNKGLVQPCGWLDAWPPNVVAQAQTTICAIMGLRDMAAIEAHLRNAEAREFADNAAAYEARLKEVFYDSATGLYGEQLLDDGSVKGGTSQTFFAHTQIWAALAGLAPDTRGLDLCREKCLARGMKVVPPSAMDEAYLADSIDGEESLSVDSTATWLLAHWPELTHLYALAEIRSGRPDYALAAVSSQLPEHLHRQDPRCAPTHYAEKYLGEGLTPWLFTWAGDPSLVEVVLCGFLGLRADLAGVAISPSLPTAWRDLTIETDCWWSGRSVHVEVSPRSPAGDVQFRDGSAVGIGVP